MARLQQTPASRCAAEQAGSPIVICVLGNFRLLKAGHPVTVRSGKAEVLLGNLALQHAGDGIPREALLDTLWPDSEYALAGQSLNWTAPRKVNQGQSQLRGGALG
ncbi:MAG TPA: hypothetical protein VFL91_27790 [Thermomicrobiales bacterium]|nr:hypothetical protein [Thermomicrobiales bacterium]